MVTVAEKYPWQEYDCPIQQADTDLHDDDMVHAGQTINCSWCGDQHPAEIAQTYDHNRNVVPLPVNAAALAALWAAAKNGGS